MPAVYVSIKEEDKWTEKQIQELGDALQVIIMQGMNFLGDKEHQVKDSDSIKVKGIPSHPLDRTNRDLTLQIFAHEYPKRKENANKICRVIRKYLTRFLPKRSMKILVTLHLGHVGVSFTGEDETVD